MNETKVFIWPNPASDELHVQMPYVKGTMDITDMTGRVIWKNTITSNSEVISIKQLGAGIYVLRIKYNDKTYVEKFVKE